MKNKTLIKGVSSNQYVAKGIKENARRANCENRHRVVHFVQVIYVHQRLQGLDQQRKTERREENAADERRNDIYPRPAKCVLHPPIRS